MSNVVIMLRSILSAFKFECKQRVRYELLFFKNFCHWIKVFLEFNEFYYQVLHNIILQNDFKVYSTFKPILQKLF